MNYLKRNLVAFDQALNAICDGNPDNTVSARLGYFRSTYPDERLWKILSGTVDTLFWFIEGHSHCYRAYLNDRHETFSAGSRYAKWALTFGVIATFVLLIVPFVLANVFARFAWRTKLHQPPPKDGFPITHPPIKAEVITVLWSKLDWLRRGPNVLPEPKYSGEKFLFVNRHGQKMVKGSCFIDAQSKGDFPVYILRLVTYDENLR